VNEPVELRVATPYVTSSQPDRLEADRPAFPTVVEWNDAKFLLPEGLLQCCRQIYLSISPSGVAELGVVGVTSSWRREGRTSVALGLAATLAADSADQTLLIECDFEQAALAPAFGVTADGGLVDWLNGIAPLRLVQSASLGNVVVVCAGAAFANPTQAMQRLVQSRLVDEVRSRFRNVVLDLPPLLGAPYGTLAARQAERLALVVRHGATPIDDVQRSVRLVGKERLAGIVLNSEVVKTPRWLRRLL
jgi:Mrp family chromosome partitioning ATPase